MSRYSGLWVGFKVLSETADSSASVHVDPHRIEIRTPTDFILPPDGVHIRWPDDWLGQERRVITVKQPAALAYWRANRLDRLMLGRPDARFGIVTVGKSYLDVRQALDELGIDEAEAERLGIAIYKVGMVWPLETQGAMAFAEGKREILVVEEKRAIIEQQLKDALFNAPADRRPVVVGKVDERGQKLLKSDGELTPYEIVSALVARLGLESFGERTKQRFDALKRRAGRQLRNDAGMARVPYFCSGCPHNSSTKVPDGSMAMAGIGCHTLAIGMERNTKTFTHMGAEGATWVGASHFTDMPHVFQNLGDGTYFHSGYMAMRHAVATNTTITYKILYNDAVAMTGGQPHDGNVHPWTISQQVHAEGVRRIALVSDEPDKYPIGTEWAPGVTFHHRDQLDEVQRDLREYKGVSVLIYDQTCAAEKRRRRKRGTFPDPNKRVLINQAVCEGCGDCSVASNCLSVTPVETEFGTKRAIDQSSCNKDFSCLNGFCPSFVTVEGGKLRQGKAAKPATRSGRAAASRGAHPAVGRRQALRRADHRHRRHRRRDHRRHHGHGRAHRRQGRHRARPARHGAEGRRRDQPRADRRHARGAACRAAGRRRRQRAARLRPRGQRQPRCAGQARARPVARDRQHARDHHRRVHAPSRPRLPLAHAAPVDRGGGRRRGLRLRRSHQARHRPDGRFDRHQPLHAGLCLPEGPDPDRPRGARARDRAERHGRADESRRLPLGPPRRRRSRRGRGAGGAAGCRQCRALRAPPKTLDEIVASRVKHLTGYQNAALAERYRALVDRVRAVEQRDVPGQTALAEAVARNYAKLLAYKDEYEVARLFTEAAFAAQLDSQFEGDFRLKFHLAPPLFAARDPKTGHLMKQEFGPWMLPAFRLLAKLKGAARNCLRSVRLYRERKQERALIREYEGLIDELLAGLSPANHSLAVKLASIPDDIRGYGHVKDAHLAKARRK